MTENYQIKKLTPILKQEILKWDKYKGKHVKGYEKILKYVVHNDFHFYFKYIHKDTNEDCFAPENSDKGQMSFIIQDEDEIRSYMSLLIDQEETHNELYIQALVSHPLHQHKGYATQLLNGILKNHERYLPIKPTYVSGLVDVENKECHKFFQQFGETYTKEVGMNFDRVVTKIDYDRL